LLWYTRKTPGGDVGKRDAVTKALGAIAVVVWIIAVVFYVRRQRQSEAAEAAASAAARPSASSPTSAAPSTVASSPGPKRVAPPANVSECVSGFFDAKSFPQNQPDFSFVCAMADPIKGGTEVRSKLVSAAGVGLVTAAMRDWAGLGWYEMAGYSLLRSACCAKPPALSWTFAPACPVERALTALEEAIATRDRAGMDAALDTYNNDVVCLNQFGQAPNFGQTGPPGAGRPAFEKLRDRLR
jgi:hypothetical protein